MLIATERTKCFRITVNLQQFFTVYFSVKDGVFRQYRGARDKDSFIAYIEEKKWSGVEPISGQYR
jgi:hypothetical protein